MKGKRYSQEQKVYALKQVEAGTQVVEVCRQLGVSVATFYQWKRTLGSMGISELNELRVLRDENQRLKRLVADLTLDKHILQEVVSKKVYSLPVAEEIAQWICATFSVTEITWSCRLILLQRSVFYHKGHPRDYTLLRRRLRELAGTRVRYGYRRLVDFCLEERASTMDTTPSTGSTEKRI